MLRTIERLNMPYISLELMIFLGRIENFQFLPKTGKIVQNIPKFHLKNPSSPEKMAKIG